MEILETVLTMLAGAATWEVSGLLYRTFKSALEDRRVLNDYSGDYPPVDRITGTSRGLEAPQGDIYQKAKDKMLGKDDYPVFKEGDHVVRSNGWLVHKGEHGTVMRDSGATEKYVLVNWTNNQIWVSKNCLC